MVNRISLLKDQYKTSQTQKSKNELRAKKMIQISGNKRRKVRKNLSELVNFWISDVRESIEKATPAADLSAGLTVAAVAIPLNLALAIAAGLPPAVGIISGGIGGFIGALLGGSRWQVTGPAAALNFMVAALVSQHGAIAAAAAAIIVGIIQVLLCFLFAGKLIKFVPEAVLIGFTTGVGLKLLDGQIPLLLGIDHDIVELVSTLHDPVWLHQVSWFSFICGLFVIMMMLSLRQFKRFPAALVGLVLATAVSVYLKWKLQRVGVIPDQIPDAQMPQLDIATWTQIAMSCIPLGLLAAAESLLSARSLDRMTGNTKPHNSDVELFGQGVANLGVGLFGGMPVTGVMVRGTANVQSGAKTRFAAAAHGLILICAILFAGKILGQVPISALAGLLCVVGFRLVEFKELIHLFKTNKLYAIAFLFATVGTVTENLVTGLLAALAICYVEHLLTSTKRAAEKEKAGQRQQGIRAILQAGHHHEERKKNAYLLNTRNTQWSRHVNEQPTIAPSAFVHPNATVIGRVILEDNVHVAAEAALRADEGTPFFVGADTNIQDGVVLHALKEKWVTVGEEKWAIYIGKEVSMAHQALVHGPCYIGDHTFVGFKAVVHDSVVGSHCFIGIGAVVVGVEIPDNRFVPHGMIVDSLEKVNTLPIVAPEQMHFNEDVVEVNQGLAEAYRFLDYNNKMPAIQALVEDLQPDEPLNLKTQNVF